MFTACNFVVKTEALSSVDVLLVRSGLQSVALFVIAKVLGHSLWLKPVNGSSATLRWSLAFAGLSSNYKYLLKKEGPAYPTPAFICRRLFSELVGLLCRPEHCLGRCNGTCLYRTPIHTVLRMDLHPEAGGDVHQAGLCYPFNSWRGACRPTPLVDVENSTAARLHGIMSYIYDCTNKKISDMSFGLGSFAI